MSRQFLALTALLGYFHEIMAAVFPRQVALSNESDYSRHEVEHVDGLRVPLTVELPE